MRGTLADLTARRLAVAIAALLVAAGFARMAFPAFGLMFANDCDNMAGECLRQRQGLAIQLIAALCVAAAAGLGWMAWRTIAHGMPRRVTAVLAVGVCMLAVLVLVDPVGHLDNRWSGWLAD